MRQKASDVEPADLVELAKLRDEQARRRYFDAHGELKRPETVWALAAESGQLLRADLDRADDLAATALWLAEAVNDSGARARALRAAANVAHYRRDYSRSAELYERSIELFDRLGDEHEAAISRYSSLSSLGQLASYDRAVELAAVARRTFEKLDDRARLAALELNVGFLYSRRDRFTEALERYRVALPLCEEAGRPFDVATALRNIAVTHQDLNDFRSAQQAYERARTYSIEQGLELIAVEVEYNIAYLFYLRGEYTEAIARFEGARSLSEKHGDRHHRALCDLDLAEIFLQLNLVRDAEHLAREAYDGFETLRMSYETGKALAYRAVAATRSGQPGEALELLDRAEEIFAGQGNSAWTAMTVLYKALSHYSAGRLDEARRLAASAHQAFVAASVPSRIVASEILRARLALDRGEAERAREWCASALERLDELGMPALEFEAHLLSGAAFEQAGDLAAARRRYLRAHDALERMWGQLATDELKIAFADDKRDLYEALVGLMLRGRGPEAVEEAYDFVERAKSRSLADLLAYGRPGSGAASVGQPAEELRKLREELNWYYRQAELEELKGDDRSLEQVQALREKSRQCEQRLLRHLRRLRTVEPELGSLQGAVVAGLSEIRSMLPEGSLLLEYFISKGVVYAFLVDRRRLEVRPVVEEPEVRKLRDSLRFQLGTFKLPDGALAAMGSAPENRTREILQALDARLLQPLSLGAEVEHLIVVPHDFLHLIPFHALHDGDRFAIDRFSISYSPSAAVLYLNGLRERVSENRSLVMGVPDLRAPKIRDEVEAVAEALPGSRLLIGAEATRESLRKHGERCRYLHIATHGFHRRDNPMFSAVQLGDARLNLLDLYDLRLNAELAVLSGCGTGLSEVRGADELVGLTRGLLFAGARSVLATLWDVNDESTAAFMVAFYGELTAGATPARAVRRAMRALREDFPNPYHWAPFLLTGQPGPTRP